MSETVETLRAELQQARERIAGLIALRDAAWEYFCMHAYGDDGEAVRLMRLHEALLRTKADAPTPAEPVRTRTAVDVMCDPPQFPQLKRGPGPLPEKRYTQEPATSAVCKKCRGHGYFVYIDGTPSSVCEACKGTGKAPREVE